MMTISPFGQLGLWAPCLFSGIINCVCFHIISGTKNSLSMRGRDILVRGRKHPVVYDVNVDIEVVKYV